jgi:ketosteroid isomerase-like protein
MLGFSLTASDVMDEQGIRELEARLKDAMLASNVEALDTLLADDLTFVDATGKVWSKADDLNGHRYGVQRIDRLEVEEQSVRTYGAFAVTVTRVAISGTFAGAPFAGSLRYTRTWGEVGGAWKVVAAQCGLVTF